MCENKYCGRFNQLFDPWIMPAFRLSPRFHLQVSYQKIGDKEQLFDFATILKNSNSIKPAGILY